VREVEQEEAVPIFDDTIQEKPYTDENEVMCWYYDHTKCRAVQGFNLLNCLYHVNDTDIPVASDISIILFCGHDYTPKRFVWSTMGCNLSRLRNSSY